MYYIILQYWIRERVVAGDIALLRVDTKDQLVDPLTKALKYTEFISKIDRFMTR